MPGVVTAAGGLLLAGVPAALAVARRHLSAAADPRAAARALTLTAGTASAVTLLGAVATGVAALAAATLAVAGTGGDVALLALAAIVWVTVTAWLLGEVAGRAGDDLTVLADAVDARDLALIVTLEQDGGDDALAAAKASVEQWGRLPHIREHEAAVAHRAALHLARLLSSPPVTWQRELRHVIRGEHDPQGEGR